MKKQILQLLFIISIAVAGSAWSQDALLSYKEYNCLMRHEVDSLDFGDVTYSIGHTCPDTDAVISAILCADIFQQLGKNVQPRVAGPLNGETRFVLNRFKMPIPKSLENARGAHIILVDHSSYLQAIPGMDHANIVAVFDHHGLGNVKTRAPLLFKAKPVGSTATILYTVYQEYGLQLTRQTAGLLLSAILSDTNNLRSSITTAMDRQVIKKLQPLAEIQDIDAYNQELVRASCDYTGLSDSEIFASDCKDFTHSYMKDSKKTILYFSIGCVNAWGQDAMETMANRMIQAMKDTHTKNLLAQKLGSKDRTHFYAIIRDCKNNKSRLVYPHNNNQEEDKVVRNGYEKDEFQRKYGANFVSKGCRFDFMAVRKQEVLPPVSAGYSITYP